MNIRTLDTFIDVAETGSFTKAGARRGVTQSAVTQLVHHLEKTLGAELAERRHHQLVLTRAGEAVVAHGRQIRRLYAAAQRAVEAVRAERARTLRVAANSWIGLYGLAECLAQFRQAHGGVDLQVSYGRDPEVCAAVEADAADVGLVTQPSRGPDLVRRRLVEERLVVICAPEHRLARKKRVPLAGLAGEEFIAPERGTGLRKGFDRGLGGYLNPMNRVGECGSIEAVKRMVGMGLGLGVVPERALVGEVAAGKLARVALEGPELRWSLVAVYLRWQPLPVAVKQFLALVEGELRRSVVES